MLGKDFDSVQKDVLYSYRPNPVHDKGFQIIKKTLDGDVSPVGDYLVLDSAEPRDLSEKMIINLISLLNGRKAINLADGVNSRLLYNKLPSEGNQDKIMFYRYSGDGVSIENALLTINEEEMGNG